jgi:hypothetical protein
MTKEIHKHNWEDYPEGKHCKDCGAIRYKASLSKLKKVKVNEEKAK